MALGVTRRLPVSGTPLGIVALVKSDTGQLVPEPVTVLELLARATVPVITAAGMDKMPRENKSAQKGCESIKYLIRSFKKSRMAGVAALGFTCLTRPVMLESVSW